MRPVADGVIVPGERISGIRVGMAMRDAIAVAGGAWVRVKDPMGADVYLWPHRAVRIRPIRDGVASVGALSAPETMRAGVTYATASGWGPGSTTAEIRSALGDPPDRRQQGPIERWTYPSCGVAVGVDGESRLQIVEVFAATQISRRCR